MRQRRILWDGWLLKTGDLTLSWNVMAGWQQGSAGGHTGRDAEAPIINTVSVIHFPASPLLCASGCKVARSEMLWDLRGDVKVVRNREGPERSSLSTLLWSALSSLSQLLACSPRATPGPLQMCHWELTGGAATESHSLQWTSTPELPGSLQCS